MRIKLMFASGIALSAMLLAVSASAVTLGARYSSFTLSYSNSAFSNASLFYSVYEDVPAQQPFPNVLSPVDLNPNYSNLMLNQSGGITYTAGAYTPGDTEVPGELSGDGSAGTFGIQYDFPGSPGGSTLLTLGNSGGLPTLTFAGGGGGLLVNKVPFTIDITLPGDWSQAGTGTGDHKYLFAGQGFSLTSNFVYDSMTDTTLVEAYNPSYMGLTQGTTDLGFTLYGAVPEPAAWAMLILGFGAVGAVLRRRGPAPFLPEIATAPKSNAARPPKW